MDVLRLSRKWFGFRSSLVCSILILIGLGAWSAESKAPVRRKPLTHPYLKSWYDPRENRLRASWAGGPLTERDLFLFGMMKRDKDPAVFQTWAQCRRAKRRERLTRAVEKMVRELALTLALAERGPTATPTPTEQKFLRYLMYPIYQWVWIEEVLRPSFEVQEIDMVKYYHDHVEKFYHPESVRVRYIFREVPGDATIGQRDALEEEMNALRRQILDGADFVELAREKSDAASAVRGGELPLVERGMFLEEFENQAFALEPGALSPVFRGPGGLYLVQCLEKEAEKQQSFEEAKEELREEVEHQTLAFLYDHRLRRLVRRRDYRSHAARILDMPPDEKLMIIGPYELRKDEFFDLFPYVIVDPLELESRRISPIALDILRGEMVAQEVERLGLGNHPWLVEASRLARSMWRAHAALRKAYLVPLDMNEAVLKNYFDQNREALSYQPRWHVLQIEAAVSNPYLRHPSQIPALQSELRTEFEAVLDEFQSAFREERAATAEHLALTGEPPEVPANTALLPEDETATETMRFRRRVMALPRSLDILTEASTTDYVFTVTDLGFAGERDTKVYPYIKKLEEGDVSRIIPTRDDGLRCYFIARRIPGAPADYAQIRIHVREQYLARRQMEMFLRLLEDLDKVAALRVRLPELGSQE